MFDALDYLLGSINKPGRAVRGLLGGRPHEALSAVPFSDSLGLTDPADEVTGTDLIHKAGLTTGTGFGDEALGMGASMALDPLTYLGGLGAFKARGPLSRLLAGPADQIAGAAAPKAGEFGSLLDELDPIARLQPTEALPRITKVPPPGAMGWRPADELAGADPHLTGRPLPRELEHVPAEDGGFLDELTRVEPGGAPFPRHPSEAQYNLHLGKVPPYSIGFEYGDPAGREFHKSILGDMLLDNKPLADIQQIGLGAWDKVLPDLEQAARNGYVPHNRMVLMEHPEWGPAIGRRMLELGSVLQNPAAFGLADEASRAAAITQQARLAELVGGVSSDVDGALVRGATHQGDNFKMDPATLFHPNEIGAFLWQNSANSSVQPVASQATAAAQGVTGRLSPQQIEQVAGSNNPFLRFDPKVARAEYHRDAMRDTIEALQEIESRVHARPQPARPAFDLDGIPMPREAPITYPPPEPGDLADALVGKTGEFDLDALKGAVRHSHEAAEAYRRLVLHLMRSGVPLPGRPLVNPLG